MDGGGSRAVGLPDFPRRNTRDFVRQLIQVQSQVRPMCRYIPPGRKLHTSTAKFLIKHKLARVCVQPRQLICQHDTARICCWVPCCGPGLRRRCCWAPGVRRCRSIFCSAANLPNAAAAFEWWTDWLMDRWTDGRTPDRFIDPAPHARSVKKRIKLSSHQDSASLNFLRRYLVH